MQKLFHSDITIDEFLAGYWQRKPLLIRQAFPDFDNPVSPDELAGFACEHDSNARLVLESCGERPWSVEYGPFEEDRFATLPDTGWSLLVSDMERMLPELKAIQQQFRFIPDWRFDDVMISYAPDGASVGAHIDKYDVFLLQTHGTRHWMISEDHCDNYLQGTDLEILERFTAEQQWILQPGDMLYLPPNVAHHGIADGDCMTCSIGFRTPAADQLASEFMAQHCQQADSLHYSDAGMQRQTNSAEITADSLRQLRDMIENATGFDDAGLARWFGEYISENRSNTSIDDSDTLTSEEEFCQHHPDCRFLFTRTGSAAVLFVDGMSFDTSVEFAEAVCVAGAIELSALQAFPAPVDTAALQHLIENHYLVTIDA